MITNAIAQLVRNSVREVQTSTQRCISSQLRRDRPWRLSRRFGALATASVACACALSSCSSERHYRTLSPGEGPGVPRFVDLGEEVSISTFHFPRGSYTLEATDGAGYYYRSPRPLMKQSFAGAEPHDGGIFVPINNRQKMRGYIVWAGGRTKVGNLTRTKHEFHD